MRKGLPPFAATDQEWKQIEAATPNGLLDEVQTHGVRAVWHASIEAVGFPFTWATTAAEYTAIREALKRKNDHGN